MKQLTLILILAASPALAQEADTPPAPDAEGDGSTLIEQGIDLIFRGFMSEAQPALDEMSKALQEMQPALDALGEEIGPKITGLFALVDDFTNYEMPEILPNGDILIRRIQPLVPPKPEALPEPGPNGEIEL